MGGAGYRSGPLAQPAADFEDFSQLSRSVYARATLLFETLGNVYGREKLLSALRAYALQNRFRHPGPQALVDAFEVELGPDAAKNLAIAFDSDGWVDFEPLQLVSRVLPDGRWNTAVRVHRSGTLPLPVLAEVRLGDGTRVSHQCAFRDAECEFTFDSRVPADCVIVDPHHAIAIESRYSNNSLWQARPPRPIRLYDELVYLLQLALGGLS